ncbi:MAG: hypothetical protein HZB35_01195 [Nitrospirae bacterium]|nr:hypothetical protein [Nitrospirota bacterium]
MASVVTGDQELAGLIEASEDDIRQMGEDAKGFAGERLHEIFRLLTQTQDALRTTAHPRFTMEVALIRAARVGTMAAESQPPVRTATPQAVASSRPVPPSTNAPTAPVKAGGALSAPSEMRPAPKPLPDRAAAPLSPPPRPASTAPPAPARPSGTTGKPAPSCAADRPSPERETPVALAAPLQLDWDRILERVEHLHPNIAPFLAAGRLVSAQGKEVMIGYPRSASVALTRIQRTETLQLIAEVCSALAGRPVTLGVVEVGEGQVTGPSMAETRAAREQDHKRQLLERAKAHPLVTQALGMFGGELVDVRVNTPEKESPS